MCNWRQCKQALPYLQGVVNRDIKLENTLLDGSKRPLLKICDFGYSKNDKDSVPKSKVGTPGYTGARGPHLFTASSDHGSTKGWLLVACITLQAPPVSL